ncbi:hypothetical protein ACH5RR_010276 [Cinchona calisaya]|uniref:Uncharacterized protein n=1 Tax=Cinchona calisaya TaxID=153742 RepID=A0ABD3AGR2_9GENT
MAIHRKTKFLLEKKDVVLVVPAKPTPSEVLYFSTMDNDYNLELLCQTLYVYQGNTSSPNCKNHDENGLTPLQLEPALVVKEALSKALIHYYPLAGKLKRQADGRLQITCNGDGVPFLEATVDCHLSSLNYFDGIDVETAKNFVFDWPTESKYGYHPLVLRVTKFSCGGFTIGMGLSHSVCDGFGAAQFFRAITELASGKNEPTIKPVWERERLVGKFSAEDDPFPFMDIASLAKSPFLPAAEISHECFNVDDESIRKLKMLLTQECNNDQIPNGSFTTLEALGAYIWRARYRALRQNADGKTMFCLTMGIRNFINPPLPDGYYGNGIVPANVELLGRDLDDGPLYKVAVLIKQSKQMNSNNEHISKTLNMLEKLNQQKMKIETHGASLVLTDWRQLRLLEEEDFGWKESVNMIPLPWKMFGYVDLCIFMPPCRINNNNSGSMRGGVRVLVSLPEAAMERFKTEMLALEISNNIAEIKTS